MTDLLAEELRTAWTTAVSEPATEGPDLERVVEALRTHGPAAARHGVADDALLDALWFSVVSARLAYGAPELTIEVYDDLAESWLGGTPFRFEARSLAPKTQERLFRETPEAVAIPSAFWEVVREGIDPGSLTLQIAAFGADHPPWLRDAQANAMLGHEGFEEFLAGPQMPRTVLERLEGCAAGTLGNAFYRLIVDNGFDVEVLDPDSVAGYHPGHDAANRRILQTHEIWHLVAGYSTSPLHEVAISGFQLAQFGHPYSRNFLATALTLPALTTPPLAMFGIHVALEGWRHGRRTPPMMPIDWDSLWNEPIAAIRDRWNIEPYESSIPDVSAEVA